MKFFVAFVIVVSLVSLGVEGMKDTQGCPGLAQANPVSIIFDILLAGWGLWLLLA